MADFDTLVKEYTAMREGGLGADEAWRRLLPHIKPLPEDMRKRLSEVIRQYEAGSISKRRIKRLKRTTIETTQVQQPKAEQIYCPSCGKPNRAGELICVHCGSLLKQQNTAATRQLNTEDQKPEFFDVNGTVMLYIRHTGAIVKLRPQDVSHELVIGRADANNTVKPDVDLAPFGASQMGVSRMHMTVDYDSGNQRVVIMDMGSANGLYVNGQKLVEREERVLRDGDQLRLGEFIFDVAYQHAPD